MDVDLDDAGIGRDAEIQQARIAAGRRVAFDEHRLAEFLGGVLDRGDEVEIILGAFGRRHEDEEMAVARLEGHGGAHDAGGRRADAGPGPEIGRQRALPGLARAVAVAALPCRSGRRPSWRRSTGARRKASSGGRSGCGAIGSGSAMKPAIGRRRPRQRIERQAIAHRRIAGDQVALLRAQEPRAAAPARLGRPWARARIGSTVPTGLSSPCSKILASRSRSSSSFTLAASTDRRCSAGAARATGSTRCPRRPPNR